MSNLKSNCEPLKTNLPVFENLKQIPDENVNDFNRISSIQSGMLEAINVLAVLKHNIVKRDINDTQAVSYFETRMSKAKEIESLLLDFVYLRFNHFQE